MKNPKNKHELIIDTKTAPIVQKIFSWRSEGVAYCEIAKRLNEEQVPTPTMYRRMRGEYKKDTPLSLSMYWCATTIKEVTSNMVYIGHMVQGKQRRSLYEGKSVEQVDEKDWIIVRNTHNAIINEDIWKRVQSINNAVKDRSLKKSQYEKTENLLAGLIYCSDCGKKMARDKYSTRNGEIHYSFYCNNRKASKGLSGCTKKRIREQALFDIILKSIRVQIATTIEQEKRIEKLKIQPEFQVEIERLKEFLTKIEADIGRNLSKHSMLFENYSDKTITSEEYQYIKKQYDEQLVQLQVTKGQLLEQQMLYSKTLSRKNSWIEAFRKYDDANYLSRDMVKELIHHITIEGYSDVHIFWNFKDEYDALVNYMLGE